MLEKASKGIVARAPLITIYGPAGLGKSTFACSAPTPLVIDVEDSTGNIDVVRIGSKDIATHHDVISIIKELIETEHSYRTLAIDTADWLESIIQSDVARGANKKIVADIGYGAGYVECANIFRMILDGLKKLRDVKNMAIIMVAHDQIKRFDDPINESYDRHELKLHKATGELLIEWSEALLFANQEVFIESKEKRFNRTINKGKGGERVLYTVESPAYRAKNRFGLPEQIPLNWDAFINAMNHNQEKTNG